MKETALEQSKRLREHTIDWHREAWLKTALQCLSQGLSLDMAFLNADRIVIAMKERRG